MIAIGVVLSIHSMDGIATRSSALVTETITEPPTIHSWISEPRATPPHTRPTVNPDPVLPQASAVAPVTCCPPDCKGQVCSNSRLLMPKLVTDLGELVDRLCDLTHTEQRVSYKVSRPLRFHTCC
jgi:hypothetical protein